MSNDYPNKPPEVDRVIIDEESARLKAIYKARKATDKTLNQYVVAEQCGWLSQGSVSQYMNGGMPLNIEALLKLAKALDFLPEEVSPRLATLLNQRIQEPSADHLVSDNVVSMPTAGRMLPVIGEVQAGSFCEAVDNFQPGDADEWIHSGGPVSNRAFVLKVEGTSMVPDIYPGDRVVIDPELEALPGDIVLAKRTSDQSVTLKRLRREGGVFYLEATNPDFPDRIIKLTEEWSICGKAKRKIVEL
ncbi:MAG: LexA family transcriptional regulator [Pseudomonadales bacterium]